MISRKHKRHRVPANTELDVTTFMNLMINLIPFLLTSAVFSKLTIIDLYLPKPSTKTELAIQQKIKSQKTLNLIVNLGLNKVTIFNGNNQLLAINKAGGEYDFSSFEELVLQLKKQFPGEKKAILLSEPDVKYETVVRIMDICREHWVGDGSNRQPVELFPLISLGES